MAGVTTTVPIDGRIEYIFPPESNKLPYDTGKDCQLVSFVYFKFYEKLKSSDSILLPVFSLFILKLFKLSAPTLSQKRGA